MKHAVVVDCVRTPIGRSDATDGYFRDIRADDLAVACVLSLIERAGIAVDQIEDIVMGCAHQTLEQGLNLARNIGLIAGLRTTSADAVYATAVDVPFLQPAVVDLLFDALGDADVVVVEAGGYLQPLVAVYRRHVLETAERLREADRMRPRFLLDEVETVRLGEARVRAVDPELASLLNLNTHEAYEDALERLEQEPDA